MRPWEKSRAHLDLYFISTGVLDNRFICQVTPMTVGPAVDWPRNRFAHSLRCGTGFRDSGCLDNAYSFLVTVACSDNYEKLVELLVVQDSTKF